MKTREQKEQAIAALKEEFKGVWQCPGHHFQGIAVEKDWEMRKALREANLNYRCHQKHHRAIGRRRHTARIAERTFRRHVGGGLQPERPGRFGESAEQSSPRRPTRSNSKAGVVEGRAIKVQDIAALASLPSKEELISKLMFVLNSGAQRLATCAQWRAAQFGGGARSDRQTKGRTIIFSQFQI
jgi:large subunit ribosomal protein L10